MLAIASKQRRGTTSELDCETRHKSLSSHVNFFHPIAFVIYNTHAMTDGLMKNSSNPSSISSHSQTIQSPILPQFIDVKSGLIKSILILSLLTTISACGNSNMPANEEIADNTTIDNSSDLVSSIDTDQDETTDHLEQAEQEQSLEQEETIDPLVELNLPETYFNYANIELPDYYLEDQFPDDFLFTRPVTFFDNTPEHNPITNAGATLGRVLFYDKKLSQNGTTACSSCHQQAAGFSDPEVLSLGFEGRTKELLDGTEDRTRRHSMSLANNRFYYGKKFFWDERADTLEDQVLMPFQDQVEMGLTLDELVEIVNNQDYYPTLFESAFGEDYEITSETIALALAQFVRSIVSVSSKYDIARVEVSSPTDVFPGFTPSENAGKDLFFKGKQVTNAGNPSGIVNCQGCHTTEAFIQSIPDDQMQLTQIDSGFTSTTNIGLDAVSVDDFGVGETTGRSNDNGKFKVPSLKNIAITAPYMHDGRFATLEEVVEHYSNGIQAHDNLSPPLLGGDGINPIRFNFTAQEKADLVAFLKTLTDEEMLMDEKYSDPFE